MEGQRLEIKRASNIPPEGWSERSIEGRELIKAGEKLNGTQEEGKKGQKEKKEGPMTRREEGLDLQAYLDSKVCECPDRKGNIAVNSQAQKGATNRLPLQESGGTQ